MEGKVFLWLVGVHTGTRQLEIILNLNQTNSDNYETSNAERWTFYGENPLAFANLELQYHYELNILQLLSHIKHRRSINSVCLFIDHLMNEYILVIEKQCGWMKQKSKTRLRYQSKRSKCGGRSFWLQSNGKWNCSFAKSGFRLVKRTPATQV